MGSNHEFSSLFFSFKAFHLRCISSTIFDKIFCTFTCTSHAKVYSSYVKQFWDDAYVLGSLYSYPLLFQQLYNGKEYFSFMNSCTVKLCVSWTNLKSILLLFFSHVTQRHFVSVVFSLCVFFFNS